MNQSLYKYLSIAAGILVVVVANAAYIVDQTQQALVLELGKPVKVQRKPGLKFKIPFLQDVYKFEKRMLGITVEKTEVLASDRRTLVVDAYVRYRITDPLKFYQTVQDENGAKNRLSSIVQSSLRQVIGRIPFNSIISPERAKIMSNITRLVDAQVSGESTVEINREGIVDGAKNTDVKESAPKIPPSTTGDFGIEVADVRIIRADLPQKNSESIFRRMQTEREKEAKTYRSEGEQQAQVIRAKADRTRTEILAEAQRKSEETRGEGDAEAARIFATSISRDPAFFNFYRSMQAYKNSLKKEDTTILLNPQSDFLKYFSNKPAH